MANCLWQIDQHWLNDDQSYLLLQALQQLELTRPSVTVFGKQHLIPRQQAWLALVGCQYKYSGLLLDPTPFPKAIDGIRLKLNETFSTQLNACLVNHYRNGTEHMGWHRDNEPEIVPNSDIFILSLGASRDLHIKHRQTQQKWSLQLKSGSLLHMKKGMQNDYLHALPKRLKVLEPRFSLTFREIIPNFYE
ncbi:alpha-ketoglutarate-dependent dioxygenase AlkB [Paraferrimonas sp. SM1919]|uniref:alpha-ketoglutarate-dependent dioxygenase AlkB family protein n=1 Tax=Paraferrimonas sp. SM1919 TaxID=2662263 RepID=UPI0013D4FFE6|nr:alpha-ketoglutarate-dependent dioxygenase AlkB [Paraferrimonas sp. SM1919]